MKSLSMLAYERDYVPKAYQGLLHHLQPYGLSITEVPGDGYFEREKTYRVIAHQQVNYTITQQHIARLLHDVDDDGAEVVWVELIKPFGRERLTYEEFLRRIDIWHRQLRPMGFARDEMNEVLFYRGVRNLRHENYPLAVRSLRLAADIVRNPLAPDVKQELLEYGCTPQRLNACQHMPPSYLRDLYGIRNS